MFQQALVPANPIVPFQTTCHSQYFCFISFLQVPSNTCVNSVSFQSHIEYVASRLHPEPYIFDHTRPILRPSRPQSLLVMIDFRGLHTPTHIHTTNTCTHSHRTHTQALRTPAHKHTELLHTYVRARTYTRTPARFSGRMSGLHDTRKHQRWSSLLRYCSRLSFSFLLLLRLHYTRQDTLATHLVYTHLSVFLSSSSEMAL